MTYNRAQLAALAASAGVPASRTPVMAAIALAESGGNPNSVGHNTNGSTDTGLWQINSVHRQSNPSWTEAWLKNPVNNARAMTALSSNGSNTAPWSASQAVWSKDIKAVSGSSGAPHIVPAIDITPGFDPGDVAGDVAGAVVDHIPGLKQAGDAVGAGLGALGDIAGFLGDVVQWIGKTAVWLANPRNWLRIFYVTTGAALLYGGAGLVLRETKAGQQVLSTVTTVASKGMSAKAAA